MLVRRTHSDDFQRLGGLVRVVPGLLCWVALMLMGCADGDSGVAPSVGALPDVAPPPPQSLQGLPLVPGGETAVAGESRRPRGLWVLCQGSQRVLDDPARIEPLLERASELGVSDLFVQVYRGGQAWYDASLADAAPYRANLAASGADSLRQLIVRAHQRGLRVHAWVNVLSLSLNRDAEMIRQLGKRVVQVDRRGRSLLDYPGLEVPAPDAPGYRMGTRGVFLDPAAPGVADRLVATFSELVTRYPGLDGLHLDYIRYPMVLPIAPGSRFGVGLDFGYGVESRARFAQETGLSGPYSAGARQSEMAQGDKLPAIVNANAWDAWRRDQVTQLVRQIGDQLDIAHPEPKLLLSAAVIPYADRAYLALAQDWRRWLEDGLLDFAVPMVYTKDARLFRYQVEGFAGGPHASHLWAGHGTWLFERNPQNALAQLAVIESAGLGGDALFSYDSIADAPALYAALVGEPAPAAPQPAAVSLDAPLPAIETVEPVVELVEPTIELTVESVAPVPSGESEESVDSGEPRPPAGVGDE